MYLRRCYEIHQNASILFQPLRGWNAARQIKNAPFYVERCVFGRSGFFVFPFRLQLGEAILSLLEQASGVFLHELEGAFETP